MLSSMKPRKKRPALHNCQQILIFRLILLIGLTWLSSCESLQDNGTYPGSVPPQFELPSLTDNQVVKLSDLLGRVVLLNFWASWCGSCIDEMPALERLYQTLKKYDFTVVAIGLDDDEEALRDLLTKAGVSFPAVIDKHGSYKAKFRVAGFPESYVVGKDGRLLLVPDSKSGAPTVKITGPRQWDSEYWIEYFGKLSSKD